MNTPKINASGNPHIQLVKDVMASQKGQSGKILS